MKVRELIKALETLDQDAMVEIRISDHDTTHFDIDFRVDTFYKYNDSVGYKEVHSERSVVCIAGY